MDPFLVDEVALDDDGGGTMSRTDVEVLVSFVFGGSWNIQGVTSLLGSGVLGLDAFDAPGLSALVVAEPSLPRWVSAPSVLVVWMLPSELFLAGSSGSKSSPKKPCNFLWNLFVRLRLEPVDDRVEVLATEGRLSSSHGAAEPLPFWGTKPGEN